MRKKALIRTLPEDRVLADFFVDTARTVALGKPVPGAVAKNFDTGNCAALGLFILALDDWEMSQFDDAESLFQAFLASDPKPPYDWEADYKPLAGKYTADLAAYEKVAAGVAAAGDLQKEKQAMEDLKALKSGLQVPGRLPEKLALMEADLQKKIADAARPRKSAAPTQLAGAARPGGKSSRRRESKIRFLPAWLPIRGSAGCD